MGATLTQSFSLGPATLSVLPVAMPGLRVLEMQQEVMALVAALREKWDRAAWRLGAGYTARKLRGALATGGIEGALAVAPELRRRWLKALTLPVSQMNKLTEGMTEQRLGRNLARFTWMAGAAQRRDAAALYVPGGSFVIDRSERVTGLVLALARRAGLPLLVCDYRLSPEHPCPAAIDDVSAALRVLIDQAIPPEQIAIAAESSGCAIALAAAQRFAADGGRLGALAFLSPWVDLTLPHAGVHDLTRVCAEFYRQKLGADDPLVSPLFGSFAGLPPMAIHGSRGDPLFGDAVALSQRAAQAGVDVTLRAWPGGMHVFERYFDKNGERSIAELSDFLRARLGLMADAA